MGSVLDLVGVSPGILGVTVGRTVHGRVPLFVVGGIDEDLVEDLVQARHDGRLCEERTTAVGRGSRIERLF